MTGLPLNLSAPLRDEFGRQVALWCDAVQVAAEAVGDIGGLAYDEPILLIVDIDHEQVTRLQMEPATNIGRNDQAPAIPKMGGEASVGHIRILPQL
jgi:hypothetical protein